MTALSIHRQVLAWTLGALALGAAVLVGASWWVLEHELEEVFEDNLKQVALAVAHHGSGAPANLRLAQALPRVYEEYGKFEFVTAVWTREGRLLATSDPAVPLPYRARSGMTEVQAGGEAWFMYTVVLEDGIAQAAQRAIERAALARESSLELVWPAGGVLLFIAGLVTLALRRGLRPLSLAASEVAARSAESLHPIALDGQPSELHLLVGAINDLMGRLGQAMSLQREFLADAAHELRTPVAALRLQLQLLERASDGPQRERAMAELREGVDRAQRVVEGLLQLSRLGPDAAPLRQEPVALAVLVREAVARASARAEALGIDLGATSQAAPTVTGDAGQLALLLDNLVDNALRHVPAGGRIDVAAARQAGQPCLSVTDTGPGIAPAERERVFDRFYRVPGSAGHGSGLGLAIVKGVAERHGAQVQLDDAPGGGLRVTVRLPAQAGSATA